MKKIYLIFLIFLTPSLVSAKLIEVGKGIEVDYDVMIETDTNEDGSNDQRAYYRANKLVLTMHDADKNAAYETWRRYDGNMELEMEAMDTNADGDPDEFSLFEKNGEVLVANSLASFEKVKNAQEALSSFDSAWHSWFLMSPFVLLFFAFSHIVLARRQVVSSKR